MRGVDYRCEPEGLKLLIARDFSSKRSLLQGMGRVGRYGQPCKRFILPNLEAVDQVVEVRLSGILGDKVQKLPKVSEEKNATKVK